MASIVSKLHRSSSPDLTSLLGRTSESGHPSIEEENKKYLKACATCMKPHCIYIHSSFKNCDSCRQKNRLKKQAAEERKAKRMKAAQEFKEKWDHEMMLMGLQAGDSKPEAPKAPTSLPLGEVDRNVLAAGTGSKPVKKEDENATEKVTSTGAVKRKSLHELEHEEKRAALATIKNGLKHRVEVKGNKRVLSGVVTISPSEAPEAAEAGKEYQTATALYESLKKRVKKAAKGTSASQLLLFKGFHSIIPVSAIDHQKRVDLVAKDLRKIVRLPFEHTKPEASYDFKSQSRTLTFRCTCLGYEPAPAPAPPPVASISALTTFAAKGTQGDLIREARARAALEGLSSGGKAASNSQQGQGVGVPRFCGGLVKITASDDKRHPLGIIGQRIMISVKHGLGK